MKHFYQLKTDILTDEEMQKHIVFGIAALNADGRILDAVPDIFFDRSRAEHFVFLCNTLHLALIHLREAAEDQLI